ncbi:MAG: ankyrin repeat domain-containing protein [Verrucomicrobiota bacterium]
MAEENECAEHLRQAEAWIAKGPLNGRDSEFRSWIIWAAEAGCVEVIKRLRQAGLDLEAREERGHTLLMDAVQMQRPRAVELLLKCGADPDATLPNSRYNVLQLAAQTSTQEIFDLLMRHGAKAVLGGRGAPEALFDAARRDEPGMLRQLLDAGADVNAQDGYGRSALFNAAGANALKTARLLIDRRARIDLPDQNGQTPLLYAVEFGHAAMVSLLLQHGADVHTKLRSGGGILHMLGSLSKDASTIVAIAVQRGVDVNEADTNGRTPLMCAAMAGDLASAQVLLSAGANPNPVNKYGSTPLLEALRWPHLEVVRLLLEAGVNPNLGAPYDGPALFQSAQKEQALELIPLLLKHGADPLVQHRGATAKAAAAAHGRPEVVKLLAAAEARQLGVSSESQGPTEAVQLAQLFEAVLAGETEDVQRLLNEPRPLSAAEIFNAANVGSHAAQLVRQGIAFGCVDFVRLMLEGGFPPNTDWGDDNSLFQAARYGQPEIARLLLFHGADPFTETERGSTALSFASTRAVMEVICTYREGKAAGVKRINPPAGFRETTPSRPTPRRKREPGPPSPGRAKRERPREQREAPKAPPPAESGIKPPPIPPLSAAQPIEAGTPPSAAQQALRRARWMLALLLGLPVVVLVTGALYSLSGVRAGHYGTAILLALFHGFLMWAVFRTGRCERANGYVILAAVVAGTLGPMLAGHAINYYDLKSYVRRTVQKDTEGRYPSDWKALDDDALFAKWVGQLTGREGGGVWGYLRSQAAIGWEGWEGKRYRSRVVRTGGWVWFAWGMHGMFFLAASGLAFGAAVKE